MTIPAARAIAGKWMKWLVEPPVASRPTIALTIAFSSTTWASGRSPLLRQLGQPMHRGAGQRLAQRRAGIDEGGVGHVQPHQLHHHLVGIGGAVEGAGAGRVIGRGSRPRAARPCRPCPRHRAGGPAAFPCSAGPTASARRAPAASADGRSAARRSASPGTILSQMPSSAAASNMPWLSATAVAHRDHVAAEQRQVHARLALGDAVAHRRNAARDLRRRADLAREDLHLLGVAAVGLMRRQHVVVGGDDADVRAARGG